jgi:hypothetical protein
MGRGHLKMTMNTMYQYASWRSASGYDARPRFKGPRVRVPVVPDHFYLHMFTSAVQLVYPRPSGGWIAWFMHLKNLGIIRRVGQFPWSSFESWRKSGSLGFNDTQLQWYTYRSTVRMAQLLTMFEINISVCHLRGIYWFFISSKYCKITYFRVGFSLIFTRVLWSQK